MGSAMLRGWLARGAAERFLAVEPAGAPAALAEAAGVTWHHAASDLPAELSPDAVVFAVKPQLIDAVVPAYSALRCSPRSATAPGSRTRR